MNIECVCDAISCQYCSVYSTGPTHSIGSGNIEGCKNNAVNDETADFEFCVCLSLVYDDYSGVFLLFMMLQRRDNLRCHDKSLFLLTGLKRHLDTFHHF